MTGSTINSTISVPITLGNGAYLSPLTITQTGAVEVPTGGNSADFMPAVYVPASLNNVMILNYGTINSGNYEPGVSFAGRGTLINHGQISSFDTHNNGAAGIILDAHASLINFGNVSGGNSQYLDGGNGVTTADGLTNYGVIQGGSGQVYSGDGVQGSGIIINEGRIAGGYSGSVEPGGYGVSVSNFSTVVNDGFIIAGGGGFGGNGAGVGLAAGDELINNGTIFGGAGREGGVGVRIDGGTLVNSGTIGEGNSQNSHQGIGIIAVQFGTSAGTLVVDPGAVFLGRVLGNGTDVLDLAGTSGTFSGIGSQINGFKDLMFENGARWQLGGNAAGLADGQTISGFTGGDTIVLSGFTEVSFNYVSGTGLEITNAKNVTETLGFTGNFSTSSFIVTDAGGATEIVVCYLRGTRIAVPGGEQQVEHLRIGDAVITRFGGVRQIKWIGRQSFSGRFVRRNLARIPVCIKAGALGGGLPARDLFVSPGHSMLLGNTLVLAQALVNGVTITQTRIPDEIHYYQIEFETHDCLLAEGSWSESFADGLGLRNQFHNAAEFSALHPDHQTPDTLKLCTNRPERGDALAAAIRPVIARASRGVKTGALRGSIDLINPVIEGWAQDIANPHLPVTLEILVGGHVIGTVLACDYREDLAAAGIGTGRAHFAYRPNLQLTASDLKIRRQADGAEIFMSDDCRDVMSRRRHL